MHNTQHCYLIGRRSWVYAWNEEDYEKKKGCNIKKMMQYPHDEAYGGVCVLRFSVDSAHSGGVSRVLEVNAC